MFSVSRRLGHAKTSITLDIYSFAVPGLQDKVATLMDEITTRITLPPELVTHELPTNAALMPESEDNLTPN